MLWGVVLEIAKAGLWGLQVSSEGKGKNTYQFSQHRLQTNQPPPPSPINEAATALDGTCCLALVSTN